MPAANDTRLFLDVGSDHVIRLAGLRNSITSAYQNSATVTATLYNKAGAEVSGFPVTLAYDAASNGQYTGLIPDNHGATPGSGYTLQLVAVQSGVKRTWRNPCEVRYGALDAV